jgi:hypothetical protein
VYGEKWVKRVVRGNEVKRGSGRGEVGKRGIGGKGVEKGRSGGEKFSLPFCPKIVKNQNI